MLDAQISLLRTVQYERHLRLQPQPLALLAQSAYAHWSLAIHRPVVVRADTHAVRVPHTARLYVPVVLVLVVESADHGNDLPDLVTVVRLVDMN